MRLERIKSSALAAIAVLLISGSGIAMAASPTPVAPVAPAPAVVPAQPASDSDTTQSGDQTTPDVTSGETAPGAQEPTEAAAVADLSGTSGAETVDAANDGPGGHADATGDVNHEFTGQE